MGTPVYVEVESYPNSHWEPRATEDAPFHAACADKATSPDYAEFVQAERADRRREERDAR
jgi:hypothetical protein